jgi:hypothetical protein
LKEKWIASRNEKPIHGLESARKALETLLAGWASETESGM